jgi:hypothetical protein
LVESPSRFGSLTEHDLFRKTAVHPAIQVRGRLFPDHALGAMAVVGRGNWQNGKTNKTKKPRTMPGLLLVEEDEISI